MLWNLIFKVSFLILNSSLYTYLISNYICITAIPNNSPFRKKRQTDSRQQDLSNFGEGLTPQLSEINTTIDDPDTFNRTQEQNSTELNKGIFEPLYGLHLRTREDILCTPEDQECQTLPVVDCNTAAEFGYDTHDHLYDCFMKNTRFIVLLFCKF